MTSTAPKLVADGLWHCLCPSFSRHGLLPRRRPAPARLLQCTSRPQSTLSLPRTDGGLPNIAHGISSESLRKKLPVVKGWTPPFNTKEAAARPIRNTTSRHRALLRKVDYDKETTPALYEVARAAAARGNSREARDMVEYLVRERREQANVRLYAILILANIHHEEGAAWRVAALLQEMQDERLAMDLGICHDVLRVLSVHVDYILRADVLHYMERHWLQLTTEGHHWVCAALIREGQLEMAVEQLEKMRSDGILIQPWLYDMQMYALLEVDEFDEALSALKDRIAANDWAISKSLWTHMLDTSAQAFHYAAAVYCWNSQVIPGYLIPSSGTCLNVLTAAARHGDAPLATSVFHVLGKRSTNFRHIHYEHLIQTYMSTSPPDLKAALTVLTIMANVNLEPTPTSTRPIFQHLRRHPEQSSQAYDILTSLHQQGRKIPVAALNLIIETYVENWNLDQALVTYKHMHLFEQPFSTESPKTRKRRHPFSDVQTFNLLLRGAAKQHSQHGYSAATFLLSEMLALRITPDYMTYDRLIYICLNVNKFDHAWGYFEEMHDLGFLPRTKTVGLLARRLAEKGDERAWECLQRMSDKGNLDERDRSVVVSVWEKTMMQKENAIVWKE